MRPELFLMGAGLAVLAYVWWRPSPAVLRAVVRPALFVASVCWMLSGASEVGLRDGIAVAWWFAAVALTVGRMRLALIAAMGIPWAMVDGGIAITWVLGALLSHDMIERRRPALRTVLHGVSFMGFVVYAVPAALVRMFPAMGGHSAMSVIAGVVLAVGSLGLGVRAAAEFIRTGGTPEPWDPPTRLVTSGPFQIIRHPLQLAECGLAWASALITGHPVVAVFALAFSVFILLPLRAQEEQQLVGRFGEEARRWMREVPAYVPRAAGVRMMRKVRTAQS